jgi:hypothetical protein
MWKFTFATAVSAVLFMCAAGFSGQWEEPDGRLLLYVRQAGETWVIEAAGVEPGVLPPPADMAAGSFTLRDETGRVVATGPALVRNRIFHDHSVGEGGKLEGYSEALTERFVVCVPYYSDAAAVELSLPEISVEARGDLRRLLRGLPSPAAATGQAALYRPQYKEYLQELFPNGESLPPEELKPFARVSPTAATQTVHVRFDVNRLPAGVDGFIQMWLYKEEDGEWKSDAYQSFTGFNTTHTLDLAQGFYRAHVMANAYIPGGYGAYVRIGSTKQDLFFRTGETSSSNPATLSIDYNYLTTVKVVNGDGEMVAARVNVVDHVKKSKSMWCTVAADTIFNDFTPREVQFRLPAGAKVFVVYPHDVEKYAETILVQKIKNNDANQVTIVLPSLDEVKGNALRQIWPAGAGDASSAAASGKLNILFMSEAYTNGHESFTDKNGNGVWDGDLLLDDNANGKWDGSPNREIYIDRNQNGKYDAPEAFKDTNGDGICNRYERAKFELYCAFSTAALLNMPPFQKLSDRIVVYTYWVPSKHGVERIEESKPWKNMQTAFGSYCIGLGCFRSGALDDDSVVYNTAKAALPDYTVPIVMVHDPFVLLRSNAVYNFGRVLLSATDSRSGTVLIHELGHSIGNLDDEYVYSGGTYSGPEPWAVNLTKVTDPSKVKWKRYIKGSIQVPTPQDYDGYGLFEGGAYGTKGIYRPTPVSMMRDTDYPFYKVNEAQLKKVLKKFKK